MANKELIIDSDLSTEHKVLALLACIAQEQKVEMSRRIKHTELSLLQLQLLHTLATVPTGCLTVNQLKQAMIDDSSNVSRALNKLMDKGYIVKERSREDQRTVFITITPAGHQAHEDADKELLTMSLGLSDDELSQLYGLLLKL